MLNSVFAVSAIGGWVAGNWIRHKVDIRMSKLEHENKKLKEKLTEPRKVKLICQSKTRSKTKDIMDKQVLKSLKDFNNSVDHYKKWLSNKHKYYIKNPSAINPTVEALSKNDLLALRQVVAEYPSDAICMLFTSEIKSALNRNSQKYVLRTSKH